MSHEKILSCYACRHEDTSWEAICLDFDLTVQGDSFNEVRRKLEEALVGYIEYVGKLPAAERRRFLKRHAPWSVRLGCILGSILTAIHFRDRSGSQSFGVPCTV